MGVFRPYSFTTTEQLVNNETGSSGNTNIEVIPGMLGMDISLQSKDDGVNATDSQFHACVSVERCCIDFTLINLNIL